MEALVNSLDATAGGDPAALSREQLEAELTKLRSENDQLRTCLLYTSPSPRDQRGSRMPSSA